MEAEAIMALMLVLLTVLVVVVMPVKAANDSSTLMFKKVTNVLPNELLNLCNLATLALGGVSVQPEAYCARECAREEQCRLFCFLDGQCLLSSGFVTSRYDSSADEAGGIGMVTFDSCYSAVAVRNDVTDSISSYTNSAPDQTELRPEKATKGFHCFKTNKLSFYTEDTSSQFWQASLGSPKPFTELRILTRNRNMDRIHFQGVTVRVGDDPDAANNLEVFAGPAVSPLAQTLYVIPFQKGFTATYITIEAEVVASAQFTLGQVQLINDL